MTGARHVRLTVNSRTTADGPGTSGGNDESIVGVLPYFSGLDTGDVKSTCSRDLELT